VRWKKKIGRLKAKNKDKANRRRSQGGPAGEEATFAAGGRSVFDEGRKHKNA